MSAARGFAAIGLDNPKTPANIGSALRAADCYGASMFAMSGARYPLARCPTNTFKTERHMPALRVDDLHDVIPYDCVPVAVDLVEGAVDLRHYKHPVRAFYIFGGEDATLGQRVLTWCRDRVYVPTNKCMNLAATVNVVLYDRLAKSTPQPSSPQGER